MNRPLVDVIGQGFWYAVGNAVGKAAGLLLLPILTNATFLSPDDFGLWGVMEVSVQIGIIVLGLQLGTAVLRFHAEDAGRDADLSAFWALVGSLATLAAVILLALLPQLSTGWRLVVAWLFVYVSAETLLTIPLAALRAAGRAPMYTLILVVRLVFVLGLIYALVVRNALELIGVVAAYGSASVLALVVALVVSGRPYLKRVHLRRSQLARMVRFSAPLILAGIGSMALNAADRYVLIGLRPAEEVAVYVLAVKFGGVVNMFAVQPLQLSLFPVLFQTPVADRATLIRSIVRLSIIGFSLLTVLIVLFAEPVIRLMGSDAVYFSATPLIGWIAIGFSVFGLAVIYDGILILNRKTGQTSLWFMVAAVGNIVLNLAIVPILGALGAAITTLVSYLILLVGRVWSTRGLLAAGHRVSALAGIGLATIAVTLVAPHIGAATVLVDLAQRAAVVVGWCGVLWVARWVSWDDITAARGLIRAGRTGNGPETIG